VTAVIASQSQEISGMEQKNEVVIDGQGIQRMVTNSVPFTRKQISILGQRLGPPAEPQFEPGLQSWGFIPAGAKSPTGGILAIVGGVVLLIVSACIVLGGISMLISSSGNQTQDTAMMMIIGLIGCIFLFIVGAAAIALGIYLITRFGKNKRAQLAEYQRKVQEEIAERQRIQSTWERAMERWNQLYYCARDDCVFIPGENTSAPISKMKEYLYK
jgi:flavin-dependent dehydrogenase